MLVVNIQNLDNGMLLRCMGRLVAGEGVAVLRSAALAHTDRDKLVLDLANVSTIDGAGLGLLAFLQDKARHTGRHLRIQNPSDRVRELLELTNLDSVIEIIPSREFEDICDAIRGGSQEAAQPATAGCR